VPKDTIMETALAFSYTKCNNSDNKSVVGECFLLLLHSVIK